MNEEREEVPISDRARELLGHNPDRSILTRIGRRAAALYRGKHGTEPPKHEQDIDGVPRKVNCYGPDDLDVVDAAIREIAGDQVCHQQQLVWNGRSKRPWRAFFRRR
jgi:hypothetical protein